MYAFRRSQFFAQTELQTLKQNVLLLPHFTYNILLFMCISAKVSLVI